MVHFHKGSGVVLLAVVFTIRISGVRRAAFKQAREPEIADLVLAPFQWDYCVRFWSCQTCALVWDAECKEIGRGVKSMFGRAFYKMNSQRVAGETGD